MNGAATGSRLSGTGYAPNLGGMVHRLDAMLGLFPPAAIGAGVEMGHQPIQHIEHALGKHRTLTLLALTHLIPPMITEAYHIRLRPCISSLAEKFFALFDGKKGHAASPTPRPFWTDLNIWDTCRGGYTAGAAGRASSTHRSTRRILRSATFRPAGEDQYPQLQARPPSSPLQSPHRGANSAGPCADERTRRAPL